ncbi:pentapeptide repeat-containing protein [Dinoroseobacter sp. S76]|uniref:pentapeptide repeat-containing protein n=1 Tax=Dinoroseobacter sp. S76 TaxID=3415124 RepID=UPI003C7E2514
MDLHHVTETLSVDDANLTGSRFNNANLSGCRFNQIEFSGAAFNDSNMTGWQINDVNLSGARIRNANLSGLEIAIAILPGRPLTGCRSTRCWRPIAPPKLGRSEPQSTRMCGLSFAGPGRSPYL